VEAPPAAVGIGAAFDALRPLAVDSLPMSDAGASAEPPLVTDGDVLLPPNANAAMITTTATSNAPIVTTLVRDAANTAFSPARLQGQTRRGGARFRLTIVDVDSLVIAVEDPRADDVQSLLVVHLAFANDHSPPEDVHALDLEALCAPSVTFFTARRNGLLVGVGALKELDSTHAELKSMHTAAAARGQGVGAAMVGHLLAVSRERGYQRVSLETGTPAAFTPAQRLYAAAGFERCPPFADYTNSGFSVCMTLVL
jgi:putative acetyltransferase